MGICIRIRSTVNQIWFCFLTYRYSVTLIVVCSTIGILFIINSSIYKVMPSILTLNPTDSATINGNILIDWSHHDPPVLDFFVRT
jgi:hypothetical protein